MTDRAVKERDITQGVDEEIVYTLTTTPWGSSPTDVSVKAYDVENSHEDVTSTVLSGSSSITGDVITLPTLKSLVANKTYRIEVKFTSGGNVFEPWFEVRGER